MDSWWLQVLGWFGAAVLVWSQFQTGVRRRRAVHLVGCLLMGAFGAVIGVWPLVGLMAVLAGLSAWRLVQGRREQHDVQSYEILGVEPDDDYLRHVIRVHEGDILTHNPDFVHDPFAGDITYLVLKGDETVGVVILRDAGDRTAQLRLDWVTPRHRDLTPAEFVFGPDGPLRRRGFRRVLAPPDAIEPYYAMLGMRRDGDAYLLP